MTDRTAIAAFTATLSLAAMLLGTGGWGVFWSAFSGLVIGMLADED